MPSIRKLFRLATMPETRSLIGRAARSGTVGKAARRARTDPARLVRDLANPGQAWRRARGAIAHPATRELTTLGLAFLPLRFMPLGWVLGWLARRVGADGSERGSSRDAVAYSPGRPAPRQPVI